MFSDQLGHTDFAHLTGMYAQSTPLYGPADLKPRLAPHGLAWPPYTAGVAAGFRPSPVKLQPPVSPERPPPALSETSLTPPKENNTNVYISGLPWGTTDPDFLELVSRYGQIFSSKVVCKGSAEPPVGFVQYASPAMARVAVRHLDGLAHQGAVLKARIALRDKDKGVESKPSANLYICNLPHTYTTNDLRSLFQPYGRIVSLVVLSDPATGVGRGTGFVRFTSVKEARLAKEALHGKPLRPNFPLEVKFAESNAERSQRLKSRITTEPRTPGRSLTPPRTPPLAPHTLYKLQRPAPLVSPTPPAPPPPAAAPPTSPRQLLEDPLDLRAVLDQVFSAPEGSHDSVEEFVANLRGLLSPSPEDLMPMPTGDSLLSIGPSEASEARIVHPQGLSPWSFPGPFADLTSPQCTWAARGSDALASLGDFYATPKGAAAASPVAATIKIDGLPSDTKEVDVYRLCSPSGAILQVNFAPRPEGGCTVFVQYRTAEEALAARAALHHTAWQGARLSVSL